MDLRFLALGALLPNIIDMPVAVVMWSSWQAPRLWSHSFLFGSLVMVVVLVATSRGPRRKQWMLVATGVLVHLGLDSMWLDPQTLWWPFLGWEFTETAYATFGAYVGGVLADPWMWIGELVGFVYLIYLGRASGLGDRRARRMLFSTGRVSAPIGRD